MSGRSYRAAGAGLGERPAPPTTAGRRGTAAGTACEPEVVDPGGEAVEAGHLEDGDLVALLQESALGLRDVCGAARGVGGGRLGVQGLPEPGVPGAGEIEPGAGEGGARDVRVGAGAVAPGRVVVAGRSGLRYPARSWIFDVTSTPAFRSCCWISSSADRLGPKSVPRTTFSSSFVPPWARMPSGPGRRSRLVQHRARGVAGEQAPVVPVVGGRGGRRAGGGPVAAAEHGVDDLAADC